MVLFTYQMFYSILSISHLPPWRSLFIEYLALKKEKSRTIRGFLGDSSIKFATLIKSLKSRDLMQIIQKNYLTNSLFCGHVPRTMIFLCNIIKISLKVASDTFQLFECTVLWQFTQDSTEKETQISCSPSTYFGGLTLYICAIRVQLRYLAISTEIFLIFLCYQNSFAYAMPFKIFDGIILVDFQLLSILWITSTKGEKRIIKNQKAHMNLWKLPSHSHTFTVDLIIK